MGTFGVDGGGGDAGRPCRDRLYVRSFALVFFSAIGVLQLSLTCWPFAGRSPSSRRLVSPSREEELLASMCAVCTVHKHTRFGGQSNLEENPLRHIHAHVTRPSVHHTQQLIETANPLFSEPTANQLCMGWCACVCVCAPDMCVGERFCGCAIHKWPLPYV